MFQATNFHFGYIPFKKNNSRDPQTPVNSPPVTLHPPAHPRAGMTSLPPPGWAPRCSTSSYLWERPWSQGAGVKFVVLWWMIVKSKNGCHDHGYHWEITKKTGWIWYIFWTNQSTIFWMMFMRFCSDLNGDYHQSSCLGCPRNLWKPSPVSHKALEKWEIVTWSHFQCGEF